MQIQQNISLKPYNTFGIDVVARYFARFTSVDELNELFDQSWPGHEQPPFIVGGGSNILLTGDYGGLVARNEMSGIDLVGEDAKHVYVRSAAGENWHRFVLYCLNQEYAGIENLSLIPGNVGAAPMQNVGAYGVEIKDVFHQLEAFHIKDKNLVVFNLDECEFGYRESIFKRKYRGEYVITSVTFKLDKIPVLNTSYGAIQQELERMNVKDSGIKDVSGAVIRIRQSKLPDPAKIGNAGSFFKNPAISSSQFKTLKQEYPAMPGYPVNNEEVKVAAGWLIEQCGWKGYRKGDAGCHSLQALVLVNFGGASGKDIYELSTKIIESVQSKFNISLEREVNIV